MKCLYEKVQGAVNEAVQEVYRKLADDHAFTKKDQLPPELKPQKITSLLGEQIVFPFTGRVYLIDSDENWCIHELPVFITNIVEARQFLKFQETFYQGAFEDGQDMIRENIVDLCGGVSMDAHKKAIEALDERISELEERK